MTWCQDIYFWFSTQHDLTNNYFLGAFSNSLSEVHLGEWPGICKRWGDLELAFELHWPQFPTQEFFLSWNQQGTKATNSPSNVHAKAPWPPKKDFKRAIETHGCLPEGILSYAALTTLSALFCSWGGLVNGWNWGLDEQLWARMVDTP